MGVYSRERQGHFKGYALPFTDHMLRRLHLRLPPIEHGKIGQRRQDPMCHVPDRAAVSQPPAGSEPVPGVAQRFLATDTISVRDIAEILGGGRQPFGYYDRAWCCLLWYRLSFAHTFSIE